MLSTGQVQSRPILLTLFFAVTIVFMVSCGGGDEDSTVECDKIFNADAGIWECVKDSQNNDSASSIANNSTDTVTIIKPTPVPTPLITNDSEAGRELWVYLTKCVSVDIDHLNVNTATKGDWLIKPANNSPQEFGTWLIKPSGAILAHNSKAGLWDSYLKGNCDNTIMAPAATDVLDETGAATVLWTQLAKCHPELPVSMLIAHRSQQTGDWVVVSDPSYAMDDYGVWSVERDATIKPLNERATEVWAALSLSSDAASSANTAEIAAGCTPVIRNLQEANDRIYAFLSSCYPYLTPDEMTMSTTRDPMKHVWLVVTSEPSADNTTEWKQSVWSVDGSGKVIPTNASARATLAIVDAGKC